MSLTATILWLLCLLIDTAGQLILKSGAINIPTTNNIQRWKSILSNFWIWIAISSYVFEFLLWMAFLSLVPLSQGIFVRSINIITIMLGGRIFFAEQLSTKRIVAICLISVGVALVGWA